MPKNPGPHKIDLTYGGVPVPGSPIVFMCYDASKIKVMGVSDGVVGKKSTFLSKKFHFNQFPLLTFQNLLSPLIGMSLF